MVFACKMRVGLTVFWALAFWASAAVFSSKPASATIAPEPGTGRRFPQSYLNYRRANSHQFRPEGGLSKKVQRARAARDQWQRSQSRGAFPSAASQQAPALPLAAQVSGTVRVPVILANFSDVPAPYLSNLLQQTLFDGPNATGTVTDYYAEVSYGILNVTGTVNNWVPLPNGQAYYEGPSGSNGLPPGGKLRDFMFSALSAVDGGLDFGAFDNDGPDGIANSGDDDGLVDQVAFVHPETGGECGQPAGNNIWSHRWKYSYWSGGNGAPYSTNDASANGGVIQVNDYTVQPALNCDGTPIDIGIFAHEFGHVFGIPDLYDTDGTSGGLGHWSLMAAGNYRTSKRPAHWDAWSKAQVGWLTPTVITGSTAALQIPNVESSPTAFQIPATHGLHYLVENRQVVGFDQGLRRCGLLIYKVDDALTAARWDYNAVNTVENCGAYQANAPDHYGLALVQADGRCDLEADANYADTGDPFPGALVNRTFSPTSNPSVIDYLGTDPRLSVSNISNCAPTMTADVNFLGPAAPVAVPTLPWTGTLRLALMLLGLVGLAARPPTR